MDAATSRSRPFSPSSATTSATPTSPPTRTSTALSINFLVEEATTSPYIVEDAGNDVANYNSHNNATQRGKARVIVVGEQIQPQRQEEADGENQDDDQDASSSPTTSAPRLFEHLLHPYNQQPSTVSSLNNSPAPVMPCVALPPTPASMPSLPPYPPPQQRQPSTTSSSSTSTTTLAAYPAYNLLASFASSDSSSPSPRPLTSPYETMLPPPVPMLTTPPGAPMIYDIQFLSQLYLQASPYLLISSLFPGATLARSSPTASASSSQYVFHPVMALAHLHPLQPPPPPSPQPTSTQHVPQSSSPAESPITPSRSGMDPPVAGGGDGAPVSVLESILSRAERQVQEEGAHNQARNGRAKREKREPHNDGEPDYRIKRRRSHRDSNYSPYGGGQRQCRSDDDDDRHGRPFSGSSSGSSGDSNAESSGGGSSSRDSSKQGAVAGMKEVHHQRRHASPEQVVLLEQVFAVEPIPTSATKFRLSEVLDMSPKRVAVWFKNKRARQKKGIRRPTLASSSLSGT